MLAGICLFLVAAVVPFFTPRTPHDVNRLSYTLGIVAGILFLVLAVIVLITGQTVTTDSYPVAYHIGLTFVIDRLAAFFIFIICAVWTAAGIYSLSYEHGPFNRRWLMESMIAVFVLSMLLVVSAASTYTLLFFWETMSISSFFLVMYDYEEKITGKSGLFYFVMTQLSTVFLIFSFVVMYGLTGSFDIAIIPGANTAIYAALFLSLFIGFGIKAGVMPFHKWLPYAHSASPSNVSALMSGVMVKVAIYGMVRFLLVNMQPDLWWGIVILTFGSISALLGVMYALKEHDIKKMLANCSIENIGVILLGIGLSIVFNYYNLPALALLALAGGLFHTLNHALFKSLLFLTTGSVVHATGTRDIEKMGGLVKTMPVTGVLFLVGAFSISALPPFNGFVSELMIFQAFFQSFRIGVPLIEVFLFAALSMFALTSALSAACFVKAFSAMFLALPRSHEAEHAHEAPRSMLIGPAILAGMCILLGIFSFQIFQLAGYQISTPDLLPAGILLIVFFGLTALFINRFGIRKSRVSETWGCGLISQNSNMEYSASGFSEPILTIFKPIYRTTKISRRVYSDKQETTVRGGFVEIKTFKLFEERIYLPVARWVEKLAVKVANAQDVDLEAHILYAFVAIGVILVVVWWLT